MYTSWGQMRYWKTFRKVHQNLRNLHVLDGNVLEDLAVVHIPYSLIIPNLGGKKNSSQNNSFPVGWTNVDFSIS